MRDETYYRTLMHLHQNEAGVTLNGGPTWAFCAALHPEDRSTLVIFKGKFLYQDEGRGRTFKAEVLFNKLPVARIEWAYDCLAVVTPNGSRLIVADHTDKLLGEAESLGLPVRFLQPRVLDTGEPEQPIQPPTVSSILALLRRPE